MNRKPIFDAVRIMIDRAFRGSEITALDSAIDAAVSLAPKPPIRTLGPAGAELIKRWESCGRLRGDGRFEAYPDPGSSDGKPWTIGWGSTGPDIASATVWTQAECDARFDHDAARYAAEVIRAIGEAATTQPQLDALVSFHYNTGQIAPATLTRKHCAGDFAGAQAEFAKWIYNDGKVLRGLVRRRGEEAALYGRAN
ncbi:MAG: glycoside hydrolase family 24 [Novosphingobium sp.]|nr:glycoside hydrolase family 24 [Novosphingobium sp.]